MLKGLGILATGIFVGAVGMEIIRKKHPESLNKLYAMKNGTITRVKKEFMKGYHSALKGEEPARAA